MEKCEQVNSLKRFDVDELRAQFFSRLVEKETIAVCDVQPNNGRRIVWMEEEVTPVSNSNQRKRPN